jgi:hypothetical protein
MNDGDDPRTPDAPEHTASLEGEAQERAIESHIVHLRDELGEIVGELDRRRHEAFDVRLQVRRHAGIVATVATVAVVVAIGGFVAWRASRRRQRSMLVRMQNLGRAVAIMARDPDRLERALSRRPEPGAAVMTALGKVAGAAGQRALLG